jgi:hypothetical protein
MSLNFLDALYELHKRMISSKPRCACQAHHSLLDIGMDGAIRRFPVLRPSIISIAPAFRRDA